MNEIGNIALQLALVFAAYAVVASLIGVHRRKPGLVASAEQGTHLVAWLVTVSVLCLVALLVRNDFNNRYVWSVSSEGLPTVYRISALWAGQAGSLLFWSWIFVVTASAVLVLQRGRNRRVLPWVNAIIMLNVFFFLWLNVIYANPFQQYYEVSADGSRTLFTPARGSGLNPQLHHPLMCIHPVVLYVGYIGLVVPFAFACGSLLAGDYSGRWLRETRRWTLFAWLSLGVGIVLGARWAYTELGWGGYWAWDPVENASLMPWLSATAFLHSMVLQERRGMLRRWNVVLAVGTYLLCLFGAFLTRSGLVSSVHAYAKSEIAQHFSIFMVLMVIAPALVLARHLGKLKGGAPLGSFFSREGLLFWNNVFLLVGCLIVFVGTMVPAVSEGMSGQKREASPDFFNRLTPPVVILLLVLLGMVPAGGAKSEGGGRLRARIWKPALAGVAVAAGLSLSGLVRDVYAVAALGVSAFALIGVLQNVYGDSHQVSAGRGQGLGRALVEMVRRLPRRSGAYLAHAGVILMIVGFAGAALNREASGSVRIGQSLALGDLSVRLETIREKESDLYVAAITTLSLWEGDRRVAVLRPEARSYRDQDRRTSEVALHSTLGRDVYVIFSGYDDRAKQLAHLEMYVRPLVNWIWIGGILALVGSFLCFGPFRRSEATVLARATAPAG